MSRSSADDAFFHRRRRLRAELKTACAAAAKETGWTARQNLLLREHEGVFYAARVELVYELTPRSLAASFAMSILCAAFFSEGNAPWATPAWWVALTAVTALRYRQVRRFRTQKPDPSEASVWARRAVFWAGAAGVLWGAFITLIVPARMLLT